MKNRLLTAVLLMCLTVPLQAQNLKCIIQKGNYYTLAGYKAGSVNKTDTIRLNFRFTSIAISTKENILSASPYIIADKDTLWFTDNVDVEKDGKSWISDLIILKSPSDKIIFNNSLISDSIYFHLHYTGEDNFQQRVSGKNQTAPCEKPASISQETWRVGLPAPTGTVTPNSVHNIIVHHSAGSNTSTDYFNIVRNIYLYHTQTNKWDDIGYNYLIAQDGTLFEGRDGRGIVEGDNVLGAHFCSSNTGTMGICLLGDYTFVSPTPEAKETLTSLISWKIKKDQLDPSGIYPNPKNLFLPVIAGHRDGCSTECPGDKTYDFLPELRDTVKTILNKECGYVANTIELHTSDNRISVSPNPAESGTTLSLSLKNNESVKKIEFVSLRGDFKTELNIQENQKSVLAPSHSGFYLMRIYTSVKNYTIPLIVY